MAIYALQFSPVSRRTGASAVRHAAYRAGARLREERRGRVHDYSDKADVVHREILAPAHAPDWVRDRAELWNRVEARERRQDSRLAQEVYVAIPREIPPARRDAAIRDFVQDHFVARGMVADVALHAPKARDGRENPHAHILLTTRCLEGDGFGLKERAWSHPREVGAMRVAWERHANRALIRAGSLERVDARSLAAQRSELEARLERAIDAGDRATARRLTEQVVALEREPEPPLGRAASEMEKKGQRTRRGDQVRAVRERNALRARTRLQERLRETERQLARHRTRQRIERLRAYVLGALGRQRIRTPPERDRPQDRDRVLPQRAEPDPDPALREFLDHLPDPFHQRDSRSADGILRFRTPSGRDRPQDRDRAMRQRAEPEPDPALREFLDRLPDPFHQRDSRSADEILRFRTPSGRDRPQDRDRVMPLRAEPNPERALREFLDRLRDPLHQRDSRSADEILRSREQLGERTREIIHDRPGSSVRTRPDERERQAGMDREQGRAARGNRARDRDFERGR